MSRYFCECALKTDMEEKKLLNEVFVLFSLLNKIYVSWIFLTISKLPFWTLNISVALLSMEGQKALGFHQKYINLCRMCLE